MILVHLPVLSGEFPDSSDGDVDVMLTEESGNVLARVPDLARWQVAPTMTRGAGAAAGASIAPKAKSAPTKTAQAKTASDAAPKARTKSKREKTTVPMLQTSEVAESAIRRTMEGRSAISRFLDMLGRLDSEAFPHNPAFGPGPEGCCRLKFEGASTFTRECVASHAGHAVESMCLDVILILQR